MYFFKKTNDAQASLHFTCTDGGYEALPLLLLLQYLLHGSGLAKKTKEHQADSRPQPTSRYKLVESNLSLNQKILNLFFNNFLNY